MDETELRHIFWEEAREHLQTLNDALLQVEMTPSSDKEKIHTLVKEMNRVAHSLKGAARAVGIHRIETIGHYLEEVFAQALQNLLALTPEVCDVLYDGLDVVQGIADDIEPDEDTLANIVTRLEHLVAQSTSNIPATTPPIIPVVADEITAKQITDTSLHPIRIADESVRVTVQKLDGLMGELTELFIARMHSDELWRNLQDIRRLHAKWQKEWRSVRTAYIRLVRRWQEGGDESSPELTTLLRFLEYNQRTLSDANRMISLATQHAAQDSARLAMLSDQLQDDIGKMRFVPFESLMSGFQRMVRDLARDLGKQVALDSVGSAIELDKAVLDNLKDPLVHLLRNALDHGIETPQDRAQADKPATGTILLAVEQRGNEVIIRVSDDGRGIDIAKIRAKAVQLGIMTEAESNTRSDDDMLTYIFHSGFSTTDSVTTLSGRGLGMDIVLDRIGSLRGQVSVNSQAGRGTVVTLRVPMSLSRLRCILLRVGAQRFALPSVMVLRMETISTETIFTAEGREMIMLNGRALPYTTLGGVLNIPVIEAQSDKRQIMILNAADRAVAFEVDELYQETELVLKPLGREIAGAQFVSGAALLGTGDVVIVLDANDLVRHAVGMPIARRQVSPQPLETAQEHRLRVLVVDDSITTRTLEKNILETIGFEVMVAIDGQEAWEMLPEYGFDVIITDVEMP
ncbi:MAG: chemotaxis protein CheW, partial [Anaerolineae bacterium]|nr:chemotaxis protein CheW [Anaerolineae bacterium]